MVFAVGFSLFCSRSLREGIFLARGRRGHWEQQQSWFVEAARKVFPGAPRAPVREMVFAVGFSLFCSRSLREGIFLARGHREDWEPN
jgi:hypothetical protein